MKKTWRYHHFMYTKNYDQMMYGSETWCVTDGQTNEQMERRKK